MRVLKTESKIYFTLLRFIFKSAIFLFGLHEGSKSESTENKKCQFFEVKFFFGTNPKVENWSLCNYKGKSQIFITEVAIF